MSRFRTTFIVNIILGAVFLLAILSLTVSGREAAASGSRQESATGGFGFLTGPNAGEPLDVAMAYLREQRTSLRLSEADLADVLVVDQYISEHNGVTHIYLQQRYQGIPVHNATININIAADGSVINMGQRFVPRIGDAVRNSEAILTAADAVAAAAASQSLRLTEPLIAENRTDAPDGVIIFNRAGISLEPIPARLVYQPLADGSVRLAWEVEIYALDAQNWWSLRVDAATGALLDSFDYVIHDEFDAPGTAAVNSVGQSEVTATDATVDNLTPDQYRVYAMPLESPSHGARTLEVNPANTTASPFGWHDTNGAAGAESNFTVGNNVNAYEDTNNSNSPTGGNAARADGGSTLNFDFFVDLGQQPSTYQDAAITNLFYWNNIIHDVFYQYGFNEASGNFQENNYGNGGNAGDSVNAEAQDGGGTNNANFATPTDGGNPRMQMYLWTLTNPQRDGDFDNGIIVHEYGHGISIRLTGGPGNSSCLNNTEQAGEGWSDWFGLMLTIEAGDQGADRRGIGTYALGEPTTGDGIRDYPYSTNMTIDPRTYDAIKTAAVPHGVGSTWAAMIWEVNWALIDAYGFDPDFYSGTGGNNIALQLVVDGLKLQPCSPGFVDARDAILAADQLNNGGANQCLLWEAFAKRGLGVSASQGSSGSRSDGTEAFDIPVECQGPPPTNTPGPSPTATDTPPPTTCIVYTSTDVPVSLPNGTTAINSSLSVPNSGTIADVNFSVNMAHAWVGDIGMVLSHSATSVTVLDRPGVPASTYGCSGDDILATLDDDAAAPVENQCAGTIPTINGTFSPNSPLSAFNGDDSSGTWTLTVNDYYPSADAGALNGWSLEVCVFDVGGPMPTNTPVPPTPTDTPVPPTNTPVPPPTNTPEPSSAVIYVSSSSGGNAGGVSFADEDILAYDTGSGAWSMYIDGSDIGLSGSGSRDVDAFHVMDDDSILLSFVGATTIPNVGSVDDSDIVRFVPTSTGSNTAGTFEWYFDGSDVGLTTSGEDVDAITVLINGDIVISTAGSASVPGVSGIRDEDLLQFTPGSLGANTSGTWLAYFDGSDVGLSSSSYEDIWGVWVDVITGDVYLTTRGTFAVNGVSGDGADIFVCTPGQLGTTTSCTFSQFWDGSANGYAGEAMDGFFIQP